MKHQPNVVIVDMAHMVAAHGNICKPRMFSPFAGRIAATTDANLKAAEEGRLTVSLPWITDSYNDPPIQANATSHDHEYSGPVHPLTGMCTVLYMFTLTTVFLFIPSITIGTSHHYCLFDVLHEGNTKQRQEVLRRTQFVPQLAGFLNTQVEEQLHREVTRDLYFLDNMSPSNHIFLMRLILHVRNERINSHAVEEISKRTRMVVSIGELGRLTAQTGTAMHVHD